MRTFKRLVIQLVIINLFYLLFNHLFICNMTSTIDHLDAVFNLTSWQGLGTIIHAFALISVNIIGIGLFNEQ